jgi:hypothetical protein
MKYVFFILALGTLLGAGTPPVRPLPKSTSRTWATLLSVDSLRFVLITRAFPDLGFDYVHRDSIPRYRDSTFGRWSTQRSRAARLLRALPTIVEARPHYEPKGRDWERDFKEILFVFPRSVFPIQAFDTKGHVGTPKGIYLLRDTLAFQQLRHLLNRRADHKEQFDMDLTPADRLEMQQAYNQRILRHVALTWDTTALHDSRQFAETGFANAQNGAHSPSKYQTKWAKIVSFPRLVRDDLWPSQTYRFSNAHPTPAHGPENRVFRGLFQEGFSNTSVSPLPSSTGPSKSG